MSDMNQSTALVGHLPSPGKTVYALMDELAKQYHTIDLTGNRPGFSGDPRLIELLIEQVKAGHNQYAPVNGLMSLRERLAEKVERLYGAKYRPDKEIQITAGATEAIDTAISALIKEGDEVIIFEPTYDSYGPSVKKNGGIPIYIPMETPTFTFDWGQMQRVITANTRMIIVNSPHNPTGSVFTAYDIGRLKKAVTGTNIILLSDEVFEHVVYDGVEHESLAKYPELKDRTLIVNSLSKTYQVTGWRMGYVLAPEALMKQFRQVHLYKTFTANTPIQYAFEAYLKENQDYKSLLEPYAKNRQLFLDIIKQTPLTSIPTSGTYYQLASFAEISEETDFEFATRLTREIGVSCIPLSWFYKHNTDNRLLRFCFAGSEESLHEAGERLMKLK